ncbi:cleavage stimulation factor subunit 1 isoform X1 [Dermacentor albipictus]|uniref:cleavage stimulation factor subunit 1 isoform X1 n=1 Tax=Dermacentor albipictus TaxID=60249 RepID=UPI0038FCBA2F
MLNNTASIKDREALYRLIISQLFYDGHQTLAVSLSNMVKAHPACPPSDRLLNIVSAGLRAEQELKGNKVSNLDQPYMGPGIDLEYETEAASLAPEPALYETCYVTSHKAQCRAGTFSRDGQLVATGSADASIKILDVDRMLAKSAMPPEVAAQESAQQNMETHPVIRTLYDHIEDERCKFGVLPRAQPAQLGQLAVRRRRRRNRRPRGVACCAPSPLLRAHPADVVAVKDDQRPAPTAGSSVSGEGKEVTCLEFHPREQILASGSRDYTVKFFDYSKPSVKRAFKTIHEAEMVRALAFHPSGDFVLVGTQHPTIRLYDVNTAQCFVSSIPSDQHKGPINAIRYNNSGKLYVSASKDGDLKLWDGVSNKCVCTFPQAHDGNEVCSVVFSRNGKYVLSSGKDSIVKLWELSMSRCLIAYTGAGATGKQVHRAQGIFNHTEDYVLFPDEKTTSLCSWDSRNAERQRLLSLGHNNTVRHLVHSPTGPAFLTCSDDFRARFWYRRVEAVD